jgi:hypothetical protein
LVFGWWEADENAPQDGRVASNEAAAQAERAKKLKAAAKVNVAAEVPLLPTAAALDDKLEAFQGQASKHIAKFLKDQIDARVHHHTPEAPDNGKAYPFEVKKGCKGGIVEEVAYLTALVKKLIEYDTSHGRVPVAPAPSDAGHPELKRKCPVPAPHLQARASRLAEEADKAEAQAAAPQSDPELLALEHKYLNREFLGDQSDLPRKRKAAGPATPKDLYQVTAIVWSDKCDRRVAECVQLDKNGAIPPESLTTGGTVVLSKLVDYLPESLGPLNADYDVL